MGSLGSTTTARSPMRSEPTTLPGCTRQVSSSSVVMSTERASKKVDEGKVLARRTADSLGTIVSQVEETTDSAKQISIATQQQRSASEQVVVSMREMAQVATQAAQASRQIQSAITELNRLADSVVIR